MAVSMIINWFLRCEGLWYGIAFKNAGYFTLYFVVWKKNDVKMIKMFKSHVRFGLIRMVTLILSCAGGLARRTLNDMYQG